MAIYSNLLLSIFIWLGFVHKVDYHPLHVSTTEISHNAKTKSLEITCRIFTDDFENALTEQFKTKIDLLKAVQHTKMDDFVRQYLNKNLKFNINNKTLIAKYIGFEKDSEATNIYLEISEITSLQKISLSNTILYDIFDDQMSILHVQNGKNRKSARTNYPNAKLEIAF